MREETGVGSGWDGFLLFGWVYGLGRFTDLLGGFVGWLGGFMGLLGRVWFF